MVRISKKQFKKLMETYPNGGIVFSDTEGGEVHVTDGDFGARTIAPMDGEVFDYDWNIDEYEDEAVFFIYDNNDILQMIQTLVSGLQITLESK